MIQSSSIPNKVYKFVHSHQDVSITTNLKNRSFNGDWLAIHPDGQVTIKSSSHKGYAWDGCSPKFNFLDITFGTPDGKLDYKTVKPITYYASMFHDAIYQYKSDVNLCISRKEADILFYLLLKKAKFKLAYVYYFFVRVFGWFYGKWHYKKSSKDIIISDFSFYDFDKH